MLRAGHARRHTGREGHSTLQKQSSAISDQNGNTTTPSLTIRIRFFFSAPWLCFLLCCVAVLQAAGSAIGNSIFTKFPWVGTTSAVTSDPSEALMGGTQLPALSYTGMDGLPSTANAGNVLRSHTTVRLSLRTPPSVEPKDVAEWFKAELERDAPYGAKVSFKCEKAQKGWQAPKLAPWLATALETASQAFYKKAAMYTGEGARDTIAHSQL